MSWRGGMKIDSGWVRCATMNGPLGGMPPAEQLMTVDRDERTDCLVLVVRGEIDLGTGGRLMDAGSDALQEAAGRPVILDLSGVDFLSSSGLGQLVALHEEGQHVGAPLRIVVDPTGPVLRPIRTMGLNEVLSLFDTVDDATVG
jgi:anti-sigma B factor antagonist